jgi:alpha-glucoside transport system substrate-binding protein
MRRRDALRAVALLTFTAACGGPARGVRVVAGVWSGWELTQFRKILDAFPQKGTWDVSVLSAGNDLRALIANRVARTAAPDVALVQQPQLVKSNAKRLVPLGPAQGVPEGWTRLLTFDDQVYGTWFKAAHKSLVWYRPDRLTREPASWDDWVAVCRDMARQGRPPLAIGAADGWVLTDWFENVLLSIDPATYRGLVERTASWRHPSVATALSRLAEIWTIPGVFAGGPRRALLTQFDGALVDVFRHGRAAMVAGGDFCYPIIVQYGTAAAKSFRFQGRQGEPRPLLVGGDAAVLLKPGSAGGRALIEWLTSPRAAEIWARKGGFLSLNPHVEHYPADLAPLAEEIRTEDPTFDLSDQLGGRLAGADGRGTWKIFQDYFAQIAERPSAVSGAVDRAVRALDRATRGLP